MESPNAFNNLASNLDKDEKSRLLNKLKMQSVLSEEPLIGVQDPEKQEKTDAQFDRLAWYTRLWYWLLGLFTSKTPHDIYLNDLVAACGRDINILYPGRYDYQESLLKEGFRSEIASLKESARFFYAALDSSVQRDRGAFMGYLASLSLPDIHEALVENTDPNLLAGAHPELADTKLRTLALECIEKETAKITDDVHEIMYQNVRVLFCLKALSSFLYDRFLMAFKQNSGDDGAVCPVSIVKTQLIGLNNILFSMKKIPSMELLSALFVFTMQEHQNEQDFDEDKELQKFIQRAEKAIGVIRSFNKHIPLTKIIRCALRDLSWEPSELAGGEDWFAVYKNYWIESTQSNFAQWIRERRNKKLVEALEKYFDGGELLPLESSEADQDSEQIPINGVLLLSFLLTFHKRIFMPEINIIIRPILIDGEFCRQENRIEFTESYNVLIKLDDIIKAFDISLSASGDLGKQWAQISADIQSITIRRRKVHAITEQADEQVGKIVRNAYDALVSMEKVLDGVASVGHLTRYDTLTNLPKICGKGTTFMDGLALAIKNIHTAVQLLDDIKAVDAIDD
ncbi:MAG: DUF5312 domain-containing protein [Spirochaetaceae bacterium]|nr:DUF5312 domain-containing protein [Spirochaetaceae bacterium]